MARTKITLPTWAGRSKFQCEGWVRLVCAALIAVCLLSNGVTRVKAELIAADPYVIRVRETVYNNDGTVTPDGVYEKILGQARNGTKVTIQWQPNKPERLIRTVEFPSEGKFISVNLKGLQTTSGSGRPRTIYRADSTCGHWLSQEEHPTEGAKMSGYRTLYTKRETADREEERWYSPDLGCEVVKSIIHWKTNGEFLVAHTDTEPVGLSNQEPTKDLLALSADLKEVTPSEFYAAIIPSMHAVTKERLKKADEDHNKDAGARDSIQK